MTNAQLRRKKKERRNWLAYHMPHFLLVGAMIMALSALTIYLP